MTWSPPTFADALRQHLAGSLEGALLLRSLIAHPSWRVPCSRETLTGAEFVVRTVRGPDGEDWLPIFSDDDAMMAYREHPDSADLGEFFVELPGEVVVSNLDDRLSGLDVNPHTHSAIHFKQPQFGLLRVMVHAWRAECVLHGDEGEDGLRHLADHPSYALLRAGDEVLLAPDAKRRLVAVCTAPDTLGAWHASVQGQGFGELKVLELGGRALFAHLAALPIDGVVFNPVGPVPPRALSIAIADLIRDLPASEEPKDTEATYND